MSEVKIIPPDLVPLRVKDPKDGKIKLQDYLAWGDRVEIVGKTDKYHEIIDPRDGSSSPRHAYIPKSTKLISEESDNVLKVGFVDVQQGDAIHIETPDHQIILIDGGDNILFSRYLAAKHRGTSPQKPLKVAAMVVTHGDADHFKGLTLIRNSEKDTRPWKRIYIHPARIFHNGLVKGPDKDSAGRCVKDEKMFGATSEVDGKLCVIDLEDDLRAISKDRMNRPVQQWVAAIKSWDGYGDGNKAEMKRLEYGNNDAFSFLPNGVQMNVLGPFTKKISDKKALALLHKPLTFKQKMSGQTGNREPSASHTINGHSIVLQLQYGNVKFLFTGDLNEESEEELLERSDTDSFDLKSHVFKVPHHGSADFLPKFLQAVSPVVSVVSSGDESTFKEYIHPRATLMAALSKHSALDQPLIFVTEMVAFFAAKGYSVGLQRKDGKDKPADPKTKFYAFERLAWGSVQVRTDGKRMLVFTHSAGATKEAYAFEVSADGTAKPVDLKSD
jgi:beta-lactamase superfamily II metal-dependent hydrolase